MTTSRSYLALLSGYGGPVWALLALLAAPAQSALQITQFNPAQPGRRVEFQIQGVPAVSNPFDPEVIRVDGICTLPSGASLAIPAFWHQGFTRQLSGNSESLSASGAPEWRWRYTPPATGVYGLAVKVFTNGQPWGATATAQFTALAFPGPPALASGPVRLAASRQYFEAGDGQPLRLIGGNYCWPGSRGTYDYDQWFPALRAAGGNYARLWMCPWFFGIETAARSLGNYQLDRAWQLDYVLNLAEQNGIYLELCLDYHGMFAVAPDYWGGNNYWPANPYCITNGGPCLNPNAFFTNRTAQATYQKRLRYLVARYGASPSLMAWQFFNEIDNVYPLLNASDVAAWHATMGAWLRANDPFGHLLTTSFTSAEARPEIWSLPQLDYVCAHSYGATAPAAAFAATTQSLRQKYGKPVLVDEFGISWQGWNRPADPFLRGFRQGLWGGALGGSAGTAMSWWWENIHSENAYSACAALGAILNRTGWGRGAWTNLAFHGSATPPTTVGEAQAGAPFAVTLPLDSGWGARLAGQLAVPSADAAGYAPGVLNSFVHGSAHSDLRIPFRLSAWLTNNARLVLHLNSVSANPILVVRADGAELYRTNLPNRDGGYAVNNEYNVDLSVNLPPGRRLVEIANSGSDWFYLDWVRLEQVLPAAYTNHWQPPPQPIGLRGPRESLLYIVAPGAAFPAGATNSTLPAHTGQTVTLTNWPPGEYYAEWHDPASGRFAGFTQATTTNQGLRLPLPAFSEDLAGVLYPPPALRLPAPADPGPFRLQLEAETGGFYLIENSPDLAHWNLFRAVTNSLGSVVIEDPGRATNSRAFFRARRN